MNPEKIYVLLVENLLNWSRITILTIINPISRFELVAIEKKSNIIVQSNFTNENKFWLSSKLITYSIFSIMLGLIINKLIPNRQLGPDLITSIIVIFSMWLFSSSLLHVFCKILKGKGRYLETLSVNLQVLSTVYVFTSIITLLLSVIFVAIKETIQINETNHLGLSIIDNPAYIFYIISVIMLLIYIPLAQSKVHKFNLLKTFLLGVFPIVTTILALIVYLRIGLMSSMAPPTVSFPFLGLFKNRFFSFS